NLILFAIAVALLFAGIRRAYATPSTARKVIATLVVVIGVAITAAFVYAAYPGSRVPQSASAPAIGSHAPDFTLPDTNNQPVSLSQTLASAPKGVLLVFYRGYW
ncbi:MAG TPA: hypothetical protein VMU84_11750, partial [Thermoanaerobaculia bacterium]|nr:hypothetical protein [Thermoanaerobaculia bacterium]